MSTALRGATGVKTDPDWRVSKMGYEFDSNSNWWQLDGSVRVGLEWLLSLPDGDVSTGLRLALGRYAEEYSGSSLAAIASELRAYFRVNLSTEFTVEGITKFKNAGPHYEQRLGRLRPFWIAWYEWDFPGVTEDIMEFLEELTLKGGKRGAAVRSRCPTSGPFTSLEQGALIEWAANSFNTQKLSLQEISWLLTLILTGRRAVQIRSLRSKDLLAREDGRGNDYVLNVPRAKQPGGGFRLAFRSMPIEEDLYLLLEALAKQVRTSVERQLNASLSDRFAGELPIFIEDSRITEISDRRTLEALLRDRPDYLHLKRGSGQELMHQIAVKNQAKSERTGDYIYLTSRRFRYTKGTNLANRGILGSALAHAMDHSDTQQNDVYAKNTAAAATFIDEIMSPFMTPIALAFAGQLIGSERDAIRANDPHSRVRNKGSHEVGSCGTYQFCASGYRACYTCTNFQPWRDAPHQEVLQELTLERERQKQAGVSSAVISSTDRLMLAVQEVIRLCESVKSQEDIAHE